MFKDPLLHNPPDPYHIRIALPTPSPPSPPDRNHPARGPHNSGRSMCGLVCGRCTDSKLDHTISVKNCVVTLDPGWRPYVRDDIKYNVNLPTVTMVDRLVNARNETGCDFSTCNSAHSKYCSEGRIDI